MRISIRSLLCSIVAFGIGLTVLLGLLADLTVADLSIVSSRMSIGENGFQIFDFKSIMFDGTTGREWVVYLSAAISIVQLIFGVAVMAVGAFSLAFKKCEKAMRTLIVYSLVFLVLYMICGILYVTQFKADLHDYLKSEGYGEEVAEVVEQMIPIKTLAYLPLIFGVLFTVGYFVCAKMVPNIRLAGGYYQQDVERIQQKAARKNMYGMPNEEMAAAYVPQGDRVPDAYPAGAPVSPVAPYAQNSYMPSAAPSGQNSFVPPITPYGQNPSVPPVNAASATEEDKMKFLEKYSVLYKEGLLTDEEFKAKKKELLGI